MSAIGPLLSFAALRADVRNLRVGGPEANITAWNAFDPTAIFDRQQFEHQAGCAAVTWPHYAVR